MDTNHRSTGSRLGASFSLLLCAVLGAACGDADTGEGGEGGADAACECDEGTVEVEDCVGHGECAPKTCGSDTVQCAAIVPCSTVGCISSELPGKGCGVVGEECQTVGCHGDPADLIICGEDQIWTLWSELRFVCGEALCLNDVEYCQDASVGEGQTWQCLPIPNGCSNEDLCSCESAHEVCENAQCGRIDGDGGWIIECE